MDRAEQHLVMGISGGVGAQLRRHHTGSISSNVTTCRICSYGIL